MVGAHYLPAANLRLAPIYAASVAHREEVQIKDDGIRLGQFLKLAGAVDQGSDVKVVLAAGSVAVNGQVETRRGRRLRGGDQVQVGDATYTVSARP